MAFLSFSIICGLLFSLFFFFNDTATTEIYTLSLHDALPISVVTRESRRNSRKTTWLPRHRKMKPFPATASQEKSHARNWRSKGHLAPLMRPTKFPEIPVSLERNTEVFRHPLL